MNVVVTIEHRFDRTPDGAIWTKTMFAHSFWSRYLAVFGAVRVVARVRDVPSVPEGSRRADGEGVSFAPLPHYIGPKQYALRLPKLQRALRAIVRLDEAVIMRVPAIIAAQLRPSLRRAGHPYGLEVLGDPYDVFAPGAVRHPLRRLFRWLFSRWQWTLCRHAAAVAYVTEHALQRRYPPAPDAFTAFYSDVELPKGAFAAAPRPPRALSGPITLVSIGSLEQMYKAPDVQIDAVAQLVDGGMDVHLILIGDGKHRAELEERAVTRGIGERVHFRGQLAAGAAVRAELDAADVYCMPSRTEGMPRAMVEAMARALPCVGSTMGGIPELLPSEDMAPPGDVRALAEKIRSVVTDPERMAAMSARNLRRAHDFDEETLRERRTDFYLALRERTETWLHATGQLPVLERTAVPASRPRRDIAPAQLSAPDEGIFIEERPRASRECGIIA